METLIHPLTVAWVVLIVLGLVHWRQRKRWLACLALGPALLLSIFGGTPLAAWGLSRLETRFVGGYSRGATLDAVLMLGGGHSSSSLELTGVDSHEAFDRALCVIEVARRSNARTVVLGGGQSAGKTAWVHDGKALEHWIRPFVAPDCEVLVLEHARTTREESTEFAKLAAVRGWTQIGLVTSASHLPRACALFRKLGLRVTPIGCDFAGMRMLDQEWQWTVVPRMGQLEATGTWFHELLGLVYYRLRGWV